MVKKYKKTDDASYALGATVTMELLNNRADSATCVYVSPKCAVTAVPDRARELGIPVVQSEKAFNILSPKENCFVIGEFKKFTPRLNEKRNHIVLVNPSNSGNLGTIIRDVAAFDATDLAIIRPAADPFDPKTVRASMGAVFGVAFAQYDSFEEYLAAYPDRRVVPFMLGGEPFAKTEFSASEKYALVFGNEATGLPDDFYKYGAVKIEQSNKADSLNLATAVAVALYKISLSK